MDLGTEHIFSIDSEKTFIAKALEIFHFQYQHNGIYKEYCNLLRVQPQKVHQLSQIPFLPITFFKSMNIQATNHPPEAIFTSSGTTGSNTSKHLVSDIKLYEKSFSSAFKKFYGNVEDYCILALLPSYLEREGSSLVHMVNALIKASNHPQSGFYLDNLIDLKKELGFLEARGQKTLLIGVSFALLDFAEQLSITLKHTTVMETGGMKGRRKEMIRNELHHTLKKGFGVKYIHSEYGMTELLSQAYSKGDGIFHCPPWMKVLTRDTEDPLAIQSHGKTGGINIIDLANIYSCSFIATQDLGKTYDDGSFEVLGRFDHADVRGCNLMVL